MNFFEIAQSIIPGYALLREEQREFFENTVIGNKFTGFIHKKQNASGIFNYLVRWLYEDKSGTEEQLERKKIKLQNQMVEDENYKQLLVQINESIIGLVYPEFTTLHTPQKTLLAEQNFSHTFRVQWLALSHEIEVAEEELKALAVFGHNDFEMQQIKQLKQKRKQLEQDWKYAMLDNPAFKEIHQTLADTRSLESHARMIEDLDRLREHADRLALYFPLMRHQKNEFEPSALIKICLQLQLADGSLHPKPNLIEHQELTDVLSFYLRRLNTYEIDFVNLNAFNQQQASLLAQQILNDFNEQRALNTDAWFENYAALLAMEIKRQLLLINGKHWEMSGAGIQEELMNSLSYLWKNKTFGVLKKKIGQYADAHAFIQATGFSTQNESSLLAILDAVNYAQHAEQISELKTVLQNLLKPFLPLYYEYRHIAMYDKNVYLKAFKAMMPILIATGFILAASAVIAPLATFDLAFTAAFIPTVLLAAGLATFYVHVKNDAYNFLRAKWYKGAFEIPEFKTNARMVTAFGHEENAEQVRLFYIGALKTCDALEKKFALQQKTKNNLTGEELTQRKENIELRHQLLLEWYDIHNNEEMPVEAIRHQLVIPRLKRTGDKLYAGLVHILEQNSEQVFIQDKAKEISEHLKEFFEENMHGDRTPRLIKINYRPGFFSPPPYCSQRKELELIDELSNALSI